MYRACTRLLIIFCCVAALGSTGCSDDSTGGKDQGAADMPADAGAPDALDPDTRPTQDLTRPDTTSQPDAAVGISCTSDKDCSGSTPYCSTTTKICVACLTNTHCADSSIGGLCSGGRCTCTADSDYKGSRVWGAKCQTLSTGNRCGCTSSSDCTATSMGASCDTTNQVCRCTGGSDCKVTNYSVCLQMFFTNATLKTCQRTCTASTQCANESGRKVCNTTAGGCVACNANKDCSYLATPWSFTCTSNFCVECVADADCTAKSLGNKCDTTQNYCVCSGNSDCASNENGKVCNTRSGACTCTSDSDCPTGSKCTRTSSYLPGSKFCQKPASTPDAGAADAGGDK
jgi:hypothetical protein